jgi:hypothetical protein
MFKLKKKLFSLLQKSPILFVFPWGTSNSSNITPVTETVPVTETGGSAVPVTETVPAPLSPSISLPSPTSPTSPMSEMSDLSLGFDQSSFTSDMVFNLTYLDEEILSTFTVPLAYYR